MTHASSCSGVWRRREALLRKAQNWTRLAEADAGLTRFDGLGGFMAYEIVCDLRCTSVLDHASWGGQIETHVSGERARWSRHERDGDAARCARGARGRAGADLVADGRRPVLGTVRPTDRPDAGRCLNGGDLSIVRMNWSLDAAENHVGHRRCPRRSRGRSQTRNVRPLCSMSSPPFGKSPPITHASRSGPTGSVHWQNMLRSSLRFP